MSSGRLCFLFGGRMIRNPLPDPLDRSGRAVAATFEVVIKPAVLHSPACQRCGRDAELFGVLSDLGGDAVCLHAPIGDIFPPHVKGQMSPIDWSRSGVKSPHD